MKASRVRDVAALAVITGFFGSWFWPVLAQGRMYVAEDMLGYFYASRVCLYNLAHQGLWSWWDALPCLGMPRLDCIEAGYLSPDSLLFYLIPTRYAMAVYPFLMLVLLASLTYGLFRLRGLPAVPALFGSLSWVLMGLIILHLQNPSVLDTLVWLPVALICWERWWQGGSGRWLAGASLACAAQILGGSMQYCVFNAVIIVVWTGEELLQAESGRRTQGAIRIVLLGMAGMLLAAPMLLAGREMAVESQRSLLIHSDFSSTFHLAPWEAALVLFSERHLGPHLPPMTFGAPYANPPGISLLVTVFAAVALCWPRLTRGDQKPPVLCVAAALVCLLGTLGTGESAWLKQTVPILGMLRAPYRLEVPAGFFLCLAAARGMAWWCGDSRGRARICLLCVGWSAWLGWSVNRSQVQFAPSEVYEVPAVFEQLRPRVLIDFSCPYFTINSARIAGVPALTSIEPLVPRTFFEGLFVSQLGPLNQTDKLARVIFGKNLIPVIHPELPLLRAWGACSRLRAVDGRFVGQNLPQGQPRFFVVAQPTIVQGDAARWQFAASSKWDATTDVAVEHDVPAATAVGPSVIQVLVDRPDFQRLVVSGPGGVLVTSEQQFPGWTVAVNGHPAEALTADLALRGVSLSPGVCQVEWRYRPPWLGLALGLQALGLILVLGLVRSAGQRP